MNYRHAFHAGNFADVFKHVLLVQLLRAMQRKEKGFLYLDTHAGRGSYDLAASARGDTLERKPEWPDGIGRLWSRKNLPAALEDYVALVREFDRKQGNRAASAPRFYPGSPQLVRELARPQDRLAMCELQPEECAHLRAEFARASRASVHEMDGYAALRATLPPPERRALILIDPPFEAQDEFERIAAALREGLKKFSSGIFAVWYPLTERANAEDFFSGLAEKKLAPTFVAELRIADAQSGLTVRGCGLVVLNPPWQFDREIEAILPVLAEIFQQAPGAGTATRWLVPQE